MNLACCLIKLIFIYSAAYSMFVCLKLLLSLVKFVNNYPPPSSIKLDPTITLGESQEERTLLNCTLTSFALYPAMVYTILALLIKRMELRRSSFWQPNGEMKVVRCLASWT